MKALRHYAATVVGRFWFPLSGRRSPDIQPGLSDIAAGAKMSVELRWRDHTGKSHESTVSLTPSGWPRCRRGAVIALKRNLL